MNITVGPSPLYIFLSVATLPLLFSLVFIGSQWTRCNVSILFIGLVLCDLTCSENSRFISLSVGTECPKGSTTKKMKEMKWKQKKTCLRFMTINFVCFFCCFYVIFSSVDCVIFVTLSLLRIIKSDISEWDFFSIDSMKYLYTCFIFTHFDHVNFMCSVNETQKKKDDGNVLYNVPHLGDSFDPCLNDIEQWRRERVNAEKIFYTYH